MMAITVPGLCRYTDMVDRLVREQMERIEGASEEVHVAMRLWELPEALQALEGPSEAAVPDTGEGREDSGSCVDVTEVRCTEMLAWAGRLFGSRKRFVFVRPRVMAQARLG